MAVQAEISTSEPVRKGSKFFKPDISALDKAAYLVGMPIMHSKSPGMHHAVYSAVGQKWGQVLCETSDLHGFIDYLKSEPKAMGSGVTMPHKVAVIPYLDELTAEGEAIGAVNTIFIKTNAAGQRIFCGTNTDCVGIQGAFVNNVAGSPYRGKPGLVVGGGGTCRAAIYALQKFLGCSPVYIINRDASEVETVLEECRAHGSAEHLIHVKTSAQAEQLEPPAAIVSAVPDFTPVSENEKMVRQILTTFMSLSPQKGALLEMCYHPSPNTQISQLATNLQWQVIGGVEAMIGQGLAQASLWTGLEIDQRLLEIARAAVRGSA